MVDDKLLLAHNLFSNKGAFAIFLGSGVSMPAGVPTGWEVLLQLINRLAILESEKILTGPADWYQKKYGVPPHYSKIIEQLTTTQEERVNLLKPFFEATTEEISEGLKQPTPAHRAIAQLVQRGYIRVIVTTNFDRLMENALRELGIEATIISNPNHVENVMPLIHSPITLIKIHGDYLDTKFLNIESELNLYDERLVQYVQYVFENFGLITSGWSAIWDSALKDLLQSSNKFRFTNYFTYINETGELQKVAEYRRGKLIQIKDADSFFKDLLENIDALESGQKNSPLSKPIALARLKKYISKPEFKIQLYELVYDISEEIFKSINSQDLRKPDETTVKNRIEFDLSRLDLLTSLLVQGIYWGIEIHHDIWIKIISKHAHPIKQNSSWAVWLSLSNFSALILFNVAALTALYRKDFLLLKKLFSMEVYNPYRDGEKVNILQNINPEEVVQKDVLNQIYHENKIVPHSELLYKHVKPYFEPWIASEEELEELFDSYELLRALISIQKLGKQWFPFGRFVYRKRNQQNIIYAKFKDLENQKEELDWIKEDLFKNYAELLDYYTYFNDEVKQLRF